MSKVKTGCVNLAFWGNVTLYAANNGKTSSCYVMCRLKKVTLSKLKRFVGQVGTELEAQEEQPCACLSFMTL